MHQVTLISNQ